MHVRKQEVDVLNSLLRGEIAATETYQQVMTKVDEPMTQGQLQLIHHEHRDAANTLRQHIHQLGGQPDQGSGAWGAFAKALEGTAKVFGASPALTVLKEGEEYGIRQYEHALAEDTLPFECRNLINERLLPQTQSHVSLLDRLMKVR